VYAPHVYTGVFTADELATGTRVLPMEGGYGAVIDDSKDLGLPLWVGEFGNNPEDDDTLLKRHYELQDSYGLAGTLWLWKENQNDVSPEVNWGVYGPPFGQGTPNPKRIALTSRAYPLFTAGRLDQMSYDPTSHGFDIRGTSKRVRCGDRAHASLVFVPAAYSGPIGAERAHVETFDRDGAREVYVYPDGGPYRVASDAAPGRPCGPA
jgi:hypothetical protein